MTYPTFFGFSETACTIYRLASFEVISLQMLNVGIAQSALSLAVELFG
jgi:hypothetical protein